MWKVIYDFFYEGGLAMAPIAFWLAMAVVIIIRRWWHLSQNASQRDIRTLENLAVESNSTHLLINKIVAEDISKAKEDSLRQVQMLESRLNEYAWRFNLIVERYRVEAMNQLEWLFQIANLATLTGLLGTVFGLIRAFAALSETVASEKSEAMASGISNAMNTTAFGLIVALLCLIGYQILIGVIDRRIQDFKNLYQAEPAQNNSPTQQKGNVDD